MPTIETGLRTKNKLPDIFRTINGINLDIGPLDRLRDQEAPSDPVPWDKSDNATQIRSNFPRIILRDVLGYELDTFTTLQEAIYRAKWNVKQSGQAKEPLEWRLPKAPPPARPDLTRTFPPLKHPPAHPPDNKLKGRFDNSRVLEFDVEDVGFVKESLQYLPYAPSLSFLKQEILVGPKTYFQIVGTMLLHKKFLSQTEKRRAVYNFPGFCSGCIRMGLCYGCERSSEIHFHEDKPVKTGGGFTYFKKDRPENEIKSRNPINWKIHHPDQALKKLMEDYAGVELDGAIPDEIKQHLDKHGGHRERIVSNIPDFAKEMQQYNDKEKVIKGDGHLPDIHLKYGPGGVGYDDIEGQNEGHGDNRGTDLEHYGDSRDYDFEDERRHHGRGQNDLDPRDVKVYIEGQGDLDDEDDEDGYKVRDRHSGGWGQGHSSRLNGAKSWSKTQSGYNTSGDEAGRSASYDRYDRHGHRLPKYRRVESGSDEENDGAHSDTGDYTSHRSRRKEKLYKAPPAFKLKKSPKRSISSKSPFSTDRVYDLPKGKGINIKKSDKQLTQFKEFRNVDVTWKEPKKFELKKNDQKATKFWSGPPQKKKDKKKGDRSHGIRRVPSPRSISPDSGLDSEFLTGKKPTERLKGKIRKLNKEPLPGESLVQANNHIDVPTDKADFQNLNSKQIKQSKDNRAGLVKVKPITRNQMKGGENQKAHWIHQEPKERSDLDNTRGEQMNSYKKEDSHGMPDSLEDKIIANKMINENDDSCDEVNSEDDAAVDDDDDDVSSLTESVMSGKGICNDEQTKNKLFPKNAGTVRHRKMKNRHVLVNKDNNFDKKVFPSEVLSDVILDSRENRPGQDNAANSFEEEVFESDNDFQAQSKLNHRENKIILGEIDNFEPVLDNIANKSNKPPKLSNQMKQRKLKKKTVDEFTDDGNPIDNKLHQLVNLKSNKKGKGRERNTANDTEEFLYDKDDGKFDKLITKQRKKNIEDTLIKDDGSNIDTDLESNVFLNELPNGATLSTPRALIGKEEMMRNRGLSTDGSPCDEISSKLSKPSSRHNRKVKKKSRERLSHQKSYTDRSGSQSERLTSNEWNQSSGRRSSKSRYMRSMGSSRPMSDTSLSDDLSYYSTSLSLDSFHDTATEYYKDFDVEDFQRKQSLRDQLNKQPDKLPPLANKIKGQQQNGTKTGTSISTNKQKYVMYQPRCSTVSPILYQGENSGTKLALSANSENEEEAVKEFQEIYKGQMTLSDLESESSVNQHPQGHRSKRRRYPDLRVARAGHGRQENVLGKTDEDLEDDDNGKIISAVIRDKNNDIIRLKEPDINDTKHLQERENDLRNKAYENQSKEPGQNQGQVSGKKSFVTKKTIPIQKALTKTNQKLSETVSPMARARSNSPWTLPDYRASNLSPSSKPRSRSMIKEYQKMFQRQHCQKSGSLPTVHLYTKEGQRSQSVGNFTPYFGSADMYNRHARGSSSKSRKLFSRGSKTTARHSVSESAFDETESPLINDLNSTKKSPLKVPTSTGENFQSRSLSQYNQSSINQNVLADQRNDGCAVDVKSQRKQRRNRNNVIQLPNEFDCYGYTEIYHDTSLTPPLIPSDVDNAVGSLTSQEPDLELVFDDIIDVENLEIDENQENENDDDIEKLKMLERKRRHKHRKHRKRRKEEMQKLEGTDNLEESKYHMDVGNKADEIRESIVDETGNKIRDGDKECAAENSGEDFFEDALNTVVRENSGEKEMSKTKERIARSRRRQRGNKDGMNNNDVDGDNGSRETQLHSRSNDSRSRKSKRKHQTTSVRGGNISLQDKRESSFENSGQNRSKNDKRIKSNRKKQLDSGHEDKKNHQRSKQKYRTSKDRNLPEMSDDDFTEDETDYSTDNASEEKDHEDSEYDEEAFTKSKAKDLKHVKKLKGRNSRPRKDNDQDGIEEAENAANDLDTFNGKKNDDKDGKIKMIGRKKRSKERKVKRKVNSKSSDKVISHSGDSRRQKRKMGRSNNLSEEDSDVDFSQLPSIQSQLAKIFDNQSNKFEAKEGEEAKLEEPLEEGYKDNDIDTDVDVNWENESDNEDNRWEQQRRPSSAGRSNLLGVEGKKLKKLRSMSMPLLTDIEELQQKFGTLSLEQLKAPFKVPVYLRGFSQGRVIVKKQFKINTTIKSEPLEPVREETLTITPDMSLSERGGTPLQLRVKSPTPEKPPRSVSPPKKREIVKKVKKPLQPSPIPIPAEPKPPIKEKTPSPEPIEERPVSREISFDFVKEKSVPELPPIEIPELPEIPEIQSEYKGVKKERKLIEVTPEIPEPKKKLPPPPKIAPRIKTRTSRKSKVAEAPVTTQELQQLSDPLDFLAKYCIINPDRLPYYERVFNGAVDIQTPRYTRDHMAARGGIVHLPPAQLSQHELNMLKDLTVITHAQTPRREGVSVPEQYLEKLNYSIEFIKTKQDALQDHMQELQSEKIHLMAQMAKQLDRDIVRLDYKTKGGKKKKKDDDDNTSPKKKKKKKSEEPDYETMGAMSVPKNFMPQRASDITDEVIVSRMDDKMLKKVKKDPTVKKLQMQISRDIEKLKHYDQRVTQIEDEKDLVGLYCMDYYFNEQDESMPPYAFRRQQSRLYQKLHPDPDVEMNMDEVEAALQQINNKLLSAKEFQYIYFILDLPKREKINFRLFSIIAALSEKVTQMDPVIRKLINKVDYNALDVKMEKSKELFELLQDESVLPVGNAPAETLAVELTAGGLTPEHTNYVLSKFNREGKGFVDFLDFVTYIPLFIDIHKRIIQDPFNDNLDV